MYSASYLALRLLIGRHGQLHTTRWFQFFRSWVIIFHFHRPMAFLSNSSYKCTIRPGLLLIWMFYSEGLATFNTLRKQWYIMEMSFRKFYCWYGNLNYKAIWSLPLANDKWHSKARSVTVTSQQWDFSPVLWHGYRAWHLLNLRVVSSEQWVWHASRKRLPFRTPCPVPFWDLHTCMLQLSRTCRE